jgi:hypothetical protein
MTIAEETALAWELVDSVRSKLNGDCKLVVWAKIGAGEPKSAIKDLLDYCAWYGIEVSPRLVSRILTWIDGFQGSDGEIPLRNAAARIRVAGAGYPHRARPTHPRIFEPDSQFLMGW